MTESSDGSDTLRWDFSERRAIVPPVGRVLSDVAYLVLAESPEPFHSASGVDEISMGVEFSWSGGPAMTITWAAQFDREGLVEATISGEGAGAEVRKVNTLDRWPEVSGSRLVGATSAHFPGHPNPWAMRFRFSGGQSLVLALGEMVDGDLQYSVDSLILTASEDMARKYRPTGESGSAWCAGG